MLVHIRHSVDKVLYCNSDCKVDHLIAYIKKSLDLNNYLIDLTDEEG